MDSIRIPIHSVIDVITNSSTEIFTQATETTIRLIKELILELDMTIDVEKSFSFTIQGDPDIISERLFDKLYYHEEDQEDSDDSYVKLTDEQKDKLIDQIITDGFDKAPSWVDEDDFFKEDRDDSWVNVVALDEDGKKILPYVEKLISLSNSTYSGEANNW